MIKLKKSKVVFVLLILILQVIVIYHAPENQNTFEKPLNNSSYNLEDMVNVTYSTPSAQLGPYTHDGGDNKAYAEDGGEDFPTDGVVIGDTIKNIDDGCQGVVTSFTGTDVANMSGGLSGGTDDDFDDTNEFVFVPKWGVIEGSWIDETANTSNYGYDVEYVLQGVGSGNKKRVILKIKMPENPYPNANLEIYRIRVGLYPQSVLNAPVLVNAYLGSHNSWTEGNGINGVRASSDDVTWDNYTTGVGWQTAGGDYDASTDWSGKGAGVIDSVSVKDTTLHYIDLTPLLTDGPQITWEETATLFLILNDEAVSKRVEFYSYEETGGASVPVFEVFYRDAGPITPTISASWNKDKQAVQYAQSIPDENKDWKKILYFRNGATGVDTGDTAVKLDFNGLEDQTNITDREASPLIENYTGAYAKPTEDTYYYVKAFSADNNNVGADATPSNEISYIRPQVKGSGVANQFDIMDKNGNLGTVDVMENVFINVVPSVSNVALDSMSDYSIDWGDGAKAIGPDGLSSWKGKYPSVNPGSGATTITFTDTTGFEVGKYICISQNIGGWKNNARKVTGITATVITLDEALSAVAWTTAATVVKTRKHQYTTTGTKSAVLQLTNELGFQSELRAAGTAPSPQALSPVAVIEPETVTPIWNQVFTASGLGSVSKNMDLPLKWGVELGPYTHDNAGGAITAFADAGDATHVIVTSNGHGALDGQLVAVIGSTNYNGVNYVVSSAGVNDFEIVATWVPGSGGGVDTGNWKCGWAEDSGEDFPTDGAIAGYLIWNIVDSAPGVGGNGANGVITSFTGTDIADMSGGLSGGTLNYFEDGDEFYIYASCWVNGSVGIPIVLPDNEDPVVTLQYGVGATPKTLRLHVVDTAGNYDQETVSLNFTAETFVTLQSSIQLDYTTADAGGLEVTINAVALAEGVDFNRGATSTLTATSLAAGINAAGFGDYFAIAQGDVVMIGGALLSNLQTSSPSEFILQPPSPRVEGRQVTHSNLTKTPQMTVDVLPKLGNSGHYRNQITIGSTIHSLSGQIWTVGDKDDFEDLNDGTADYLLAIIDGSIRIIRPMSQSVVFVENADGYVPTDQSSGVTEGYWEWRFIGIDDGAYSV